MESIHSHNISIESVLKASSISLFVLSALCFMVYTTQQNYTYAEGDEDLGYDIASMNASVTVGTACTFTATVDSEHNANISNGIASDNIGKTTLNTICNDSGGYAVYAIGYTGDEYGATDLSSDISSTYNISTGTNTSGDSSSWAMKLASEPGTTTATIENGYDNYNIVPDDYTKVATLNTITDPGTSTSGSSISTTYQTYISPTQPAGTYSGKVKYTLVHPSTAPAPVIPDISKITYMQDLAKFNANEITILKNSMVEEQQYILQDSRDNKNYYVSKLKDGNIWMTQNLDIDIDSAKTYTPADTDIPTNWTPVRSTTTSTAWANPDTGSASPHSYNPSDLYWNGELNENWDGTLTNMTTTTGDAHYHIGNYYNWTAAVAMNDSSNYASYGATADQSICPAGWTLPLSGGETGDKSFYNLLMQYGWTSSTQKLGGGQKMWEAPLLFALSGVWEGSSRNVGSGAVYWSGIVNDGGNSYGIGINEDGTVFPDTMSARSGGFSVRCLAR